MGQHTGEGRAKPYNHNGRHRYIDPDKRIEAVLQRQAHQQRPVRQMTKKTQAAR